MTQQVHKTDEDFMRQALALGRFGLGMTAPNPAVGCVLVKDGQLIGCGVTQKSGRPHAEAMALAEAGDAAQGATAYVTLEPCPMCAGAIAEARIAKLFYGAADVKGGAVDNGVALFDQKTCHHKPHVIGGLRESDCAALLKGFFALRRNG